MKMAQAELERRGMIGDYKTPIYDSIRAAASILTEGKINPSQYVFLKDALRKFIYYVRDLSFTVEQARICSIYTIFAALLVLSGGKDNFDQIAENHRDFRNSYRVFIPAKKWLRRTDEELFILLDKCLNVMEYFAIDIDLILNMLI